MSKNTSAEKYKDVLVGAAEFIRGRRIMHVKVKQMEYISGVVLFFRSFVFCYVTN